MAQQTDADDGFENRHYKLMRCPSDNSEPPEVYQRGYSFRPAASDAAFEKSHSSDDYDYWVEIDNDLQF